MAAKQGTSAQASAARAGFSAIAAIGHPCFWHGGSLWIGESRGRTQWHRHHAHQIAIALRGRFGFRTEPEGDWCGYAGAFVASECTHQFEIDGSATVAHLFVEPESSAGRALTARYPTPAVAELPPDAVRAAARLLRQGLQAGHGARALAGAATAAIAELSGSTPGLERQPDPRLGPALDYIRAHLADTVQLRDVAAAVALSESRFRHLFVAETGSSFRAYVLWLRINLAVEAALSGATWTEAAHLAGFADSAHLTRTHKRMFGIEPTALRARPPANALTST
ncbi:helix-turn-helix transcriptional regulator [Cupriavidus sp. USMAHM13]|uniref:helix-turn-helix transcriptional regulator n=1 Tax=Cupriavidus sp. USMAHM13 TaxID=1389192 RepID=UPI000A865B8D|nr:AraC family transcriptional regulator [Cupriavidus sp. USMAHM13]